MWVMLCGLCRAPALNSAIRESSPASPRNSALCRFRCAFFSRTLYASRVNKGPLTHSIIASNSRIHAYTRNTYNPHNPTNTIHWLFLNVSKHKFMYTNKTNKQTNKQTYIYIDTYINHIYLRTPSTSCRAYSLRREQKAHRHAPLRQHELSPGDRTGPATAGRRLITTNT